MTPQKSNDSSSWVITPHLQPYHNTIGDYLIHVLFLCVGYTTRDCRTHETACSVLTHYLT